MTAVAWDSWSTVPPSAPASLRREETPGCGGFLCRRRTPWPLPLDTLVFFVTCFSFCFSSLLPFFKVTFISVCQCLPHSTPTVLSSCQPLYFSLSAFYFPSPSLWLLSWPFSVATAVIYHEHPVTPSPIDWTSLNFALKQQNSQKARIIGRWTGLRWSLMKFHLISTIHPPIHPSTHPSIYLRLRLAIH